MNKYNASKQTIDNIRFPSKAEADRYRYLKFRLLAGEITDLKTQPKFTLLESFEYGDERVRGINYTADFQYQENGRTIIEEVKGFETRDFKLRWKLVRHQYKDRDDIVFRMIK